jgi:hypothetical protein
MARSLNKKYFGNRNIGTTGATDNKIGGEGLAGYTLAAQKGSLVVNSSFAQPALTIPAPALPRGVQATATVVWEVESITTSGLAGNNYVTTTGGATTLTGLEGITLNITAVGSGQGEVQTMTVVNRGTFTTIPTANSSYQIVGGDGNQQATVKYRVKSITTVEKGSGYIAAPSITWTVASSSGTMPGNPTVALTTDSGDVGSDTNQENGILVYADTTDNGSKIGDIVRQVGARRFKVRTADGVAVCALKGSAVAAQGEMTITATDSDGGTYFVTKITAHRVNVTRGTGTQFQSDTSVPWSFAAAVEGYSLQVANA